MAIISYAQNYEDVILWRALKHVDKGFYIDVGAMDPSFDSVTKVFYEAGWHGINIEPVKKWFTKLVEERPNDINLQIAIGDKEGIIDFYDVVDTGLSSIIPKWVIIHAIEKGYKVEHNPINMKTLTSICEEYQVHEMQFLKIDVEGAEDLVLRGLDLQKFRPWVILIEATIPNSQAENYSEWEPVLKNNGYGFVYFDGLNRYYVATEQSSLAEKLAIPPNIFDEFITWKEYSNFQELTKSTSNLAIVNSELYQIRNELDVIKTDRDRIQTELNAVQSDRDRIHAELNIIQSDRTRIQAELNAVQSDRDRIQAKLTAVESDLNRIRIDLNGIQSDRNRILAELNTVQSDRDQIQDELQHVYNSRSYRITTPMRAVFGVARVWRDKLFRPKRLTAINISTSANINSNDSLIEQDSFTSQQPPLSNQSIEKPFVESIQYGLTSNIAHVPGEINLDEIMEKIRAEVAKSKQPVQNTGVYSNSYKKETRLFRSIKKVQYIFKKLPFYNQIYGIAIQFKPHITKYQEQGITAADLLKYDDEEFIKIAYKTILRREPDRGGHNHYLSKLRTGSLSKSQILGKLRYSPEGRKVGVKIKGLPIKFFY